MPANEILKWEEQVKKAVRQSGAKVSDREDLTQECWLALLSAGDKVKTKGAAMAVCQKVLGALRKASAKDEKEHGRLCEVVRAGYKRVQSIARGDH